MVGVCEDALIAEDIVTRDGMTEGAYHEAETLSIREWRDAGMPDLIVSLLIRRGENGSSGVCDILFTSADAASRTVAEAAQEAIAMYEARQEAGAEFYQQGTSGEALVVCEGGQAIAHYLDRTNLGSGLNYKVALLSPTKFDCKG